MNIYMKHAILKICSINYLTYWDPLISNGNISLGKPHYDNSQYSIVMSRIISILLSLLLSFPNVLSFVHFSSFLVYERISILPSYLNGRMLRMSDGENLVAKVRQTVKPGSVIMFTFHWV
jgi:hypothetical protein